MPLVLGSASPRRSEMLLALGVPFVVRAAKIDETPYPKEPPDAYLARITRSKLAAVRQLIGWGFGAAILVADTIVIAESGAVLRKPGGADAAEAMLALLGGADHEVRTRFEISPTSFGAPVAHAQTVATKVTFRTLADGEAREYVETNEWRDKAGGYAIQGRAATFVEKIHGSYTNVVGLPLSELVVALRSLGLW